MFMLNKISESESESEKCTNTFFLYFMEPEVIFRVS